MVEIAYKRQFNDRSPYVTAYHSREELDFIIHSKSKDDDKTRDEQRLVDEEIHKEEVPCIHHLIFFQVIASTLRKRVHYTEIVLEDTWNDD
jgi:hypothetical protein